MNDNFPRKKEILEKDSMETRKRVAAQPQNSLLLLFISWLCIEQSGVL